MLSSFKKLSFAVFLSTSLLGCASINPTSVADKDRDTTGSFDGTWQLLERPIRSTQIVNTQRFNCKFKKRGTVLYVAMGVGRLRRGGYSASGNISKNGRFRIEIPTENYFKLSDGSKSSGNQITYVFQGKLNASESSSGLFTIGKKELNNGGCSTRLTIKKR